MERNSASISHALRKQWCLEAAQAVAYLHSRGVIHSDLRLEQFLVHTADGISLELLLCDFGGSTCEALGLDGGHLPDDPFFDPTNCEISTPSTDIFGLGSIFYIILTGKWPHQGAERIDSDGWSQYLERVSELFRRGIFPELTDVIWANVIMGCWKRSYVTMEEVLTAIQRELQNDNVKEVQRPTAVMSTMARMYRVWLSPMKALGNAFRVLMRGFGKKT
jgi:serine/threonine protein kinase